MLVNCNSRLYAYPITRDFGFAPNPFHGLCTLATCKPKIRKAARVGDWVMGIGGANLGRTARKCIYLMKVTEKLTFDQYWADPRFFCKKPVRNGSLKMLVGDNIYHRDRSGSWQQADSHHSNPDGSLHPGNLKTDTGSTDQVLISDFFLYFGESAVEVDLNAIHYVKIRDCKKEEFSGSKSAKALIESLLTSHRHQINQLQSDPVDFDRAYLRVDQHTGKLSE